jgi:hypothetical protein
VPGGSITLAARTAATAFAFHSSATAAGASGGLSVLTDDAAADSGTANSEAVSTAAATIRILISDPPGSPV